MTNGLDREVARLKVEIGELRSEIQFMKGLREDDRVAYKQEIQTLKARVDALEGMKAKTLKIDESTSSLENPSSGTYDFRAGTNLRVSDSNENRSIQQRPARVIRMKQKLREKQVQQLKDVGGSMTQSLQFKYGRDMRNRPGFDSVQIVTREQYSPQRGRFPHIVSTLSKGSNHYQQQNATHNWQEQMSASAQSSDMPIIKPNSRQPSNTNTLSAHAVKLHAPEPRNKNKRQQPASHKIQQSRNVHVEEPIHFGARKPSNVNTTHRQTTITGIQEEPSPMSGISSQYQLSPLKIVQPNYILNEISSPGAPLSIEATPVKQSLTANIRTPQKSPVASSFKMNIKQIILE